VPCKRKHSQGGRGEKTYSPAKRVRSCGRRGESDNPQVLNFDLKITRVFPHERRETEDFFKVYVCHNIIKDWRGKMEGQSADDPYNRGAEYLTVTKPVRLWIEGGRQETQLDNIGVISENSPEYAEGGNWTVQDQKKVKTLSKW